MDQITIAQHPEGGLRLLFRDRELPFPRYTSIPHAQIARAKAEAAISIVREELHQKQMGNRVDFWRAVA